MVDCGADTKNTLKASWVVGQEYFNALAPSNRMTLPGPVIGYISTALHHSIFDSVIAKPHYARNFCMIGNMTCEEFGSQHDARMKIIYSDLAL